MTFTRLVINETYYPPTDQEANAVANALRKSELDCMRQPAREVFAKSFYLSLLEPGDTRFCERLAQTWNAGRFVGEMHDMVGALLDGYGRSKALLRKREFGSYIQRFQMEMLGGRIPHSLHRNAPIERLFIAGAMVVLGRNASEFEAFKNAWDEGAQRHEKLPEHV